MLTAGLASVIAPPSTVPAATLNVTDLGDSDAPGQLRTLIIAASRGDVIAVPAGAIHLAKGALSVTRSISIQGAGAGVTVIDGGGMDRVFVNCTPAITLSLSALTVQNGAFARGRGGAIVNCTANTLRVSNAAVTGSTAGVGGGISNEGGGTVVLSQVLIAGNAADAGGGIANIGESASLVLTRATVTGNRSTDDGGGIFNNSGTIGLSDSLVSGNTAGGDGGGICHLGFRRLGSLVNVTVSSNVAAGAGGGVFNLAGTVSMTNVTIINNAAQRAGGGAGGGIATVVMGKTSLRNSMVAGSPSGGNCAGDVVSLGHNLDSGSTCGFAESGDLASIDPQLGPLQDNGGPTATHAVLPGSPARDAGSDSGCPTTDQRGVGRPQGAACDIGAYEEALAAPAAALAAAILPTSRSVRVGVSATAFATIINAGPGDAASCALSLSTDVTASFTYQTTDPVTNSPTGTANAPVAISAGRAQSFVLAVTPSASFGPTDVAISFHCGNTAPAPSVSGVNTVLLSASDAPVPDIVALAATEGGDGTVAVAGAGAFAVGTINLGAAADITVSADTGAASLPVSITVCQTEPQTGLCLSPPTPTVTIGIGTNATPTFGVFVTAGHVPDDPAVSRVYVRFTGPDGIIRGATSVAIRTP